MTFSDSLTVVCVPLRAGYRLFGVMLLGLDKAVRFGEEQFDLFSAVADQTVIALQNAQLYQQLEEEQQRLIEADVEARRELARDLHDGPIQKVAVVAMRANVLQSVAVNDPDRLPMELEKLEAIAKDASLELRRMLFSLRPLLLESRGLGAAIEYILLQLQERDQIEVALSGGETGQMLNRPAQDVVFSIIEEALSNIGKHSGADTIDVRFWTEGDLFIARVSDNGVGFDLVEVAQNYAGRGSLGMVNMQERAERIDASLRFDSAPGKGATMTLIVPLANNGVAELPEPEPILSLW